MMRTVENLSMGVISSALRRPETYVGQAREAINMARAAVHYPRGIFDAAIACRPATGDAIHDTPVVLVHGFGHNRSGWFVLERHLRAAGFANIHTVNYNALRHDVPELAEHLSERIELIRTMTGAAKVHVVGHSLGGVILRWFVQELGGDEVVDTAVTIASPHEGTVAAFAGLPFGGRTARQLLPTSWVIRQLARGARRTSVRWIAYYSNLDMLIQPGASAMIRPGALAATNVLVKDQGHMSIMVSPVLARSVVDQLEAAEGAPSLSKVRPLASRTAAGPARAAR